MITFAKRNICIPLLFLLSACMGSHSEAGFLEKLMQGRSGPMAKIMAQADNFQVQILYTQIDRDSLNRAQFKTFAFRNRAEHYFYPASTIKLPAALVAIEKIRQLNKEGLTLFTPLEIDSVRSPQTAVRADSTDSPIIHLAQFIKKIMLVSDNDAYNRVFEFVGAQSLAEKMITWGYPKVIIRRRLAAPDYSPQDNRYTNPFRFYQEDSLLYEQKEAYYSGSYPDIIQPALWGKGFINREGELREQAFDFSEHNFFPLEDGHRMLRQIFFPEYPQDPAPWQFSQSDYQLLYTYMSMLPRESKQPEYPEEDYLDGFVKYFILGDSSQRMPPGVRIFNKVGMAYGFLTDHAYIVDFENQVEFLLSASIFVNENQIFNDNVYEYKTLGLPFMAQLGRILLEHERKRPRDFLPDLSRFQVSYSDSTSGI